jgi:polypyrimidine tract-binding protein 1
MIDVWACQMPGCVLAVKNLDASVTPDNLFTLFGVYGDVMRVKIAHNHKGMAFIQMNRPHEVTANHSLTRSRYHLAFLTSSVVCVCSQAALAISYLNDCPVFNEKIKVTVSKHVEVLPAGPSKVGDPENPSTKDYTGSKQHRFRLPDSKNAQHICAPSATLHVVHTTPTPVPTPSPIHFPASCSACLTHPARVFVVSRTSLKPSRKQN